LKKKVEKTRKQKTHKKLNKMKACKIENRKKVKHETNINKKT